MFFNSFSYRHKFSETLFYFIAYNERLNIDRFVEVVKREKILKLKFPYNF